MKSGLDLRSLNIEYVSTIHTVLMNMTQRVGFKMPIIGHHKLYTHHFKINYINYNTVMILKIAYLCISTY